MEMSAWESKLCDRTTVVKMEFLSGNNTWTHKFRLVSLIISLFTEKYQNKSWKTIPVQHKLVSMRSTPSSTFCLLFYLSGWCAGKPVSPLHCGPSPIVSHLVYWLEQPWRTGHHLKPQTTGCNKLENSSNLRKVLPSPELPNSLSSYPEQKIKKSIRACGSW